MQTLFSEYFFPIFAITFLSLAGEASLDWQFQFKIAWEEGEWE